MKQVDAFARRGVLPAALLAALITIALDPFSLHHLGGMAVLITGSVAVVLLAAWAATLLSRHEMPEEEFRRIVERSEALAAMPPAEREASEFDEYVVDAIDALPEDLYDVVEEIPIVVSSRGHEYRAYGHYIGDTVARDNFRDHIVIYRDTLERDFGHDPELLRAQVERTVRHEIAHHLGWGEDGVRGLGL
jgi:predicted Zn-dependent protease with MMP-like domain